MSDTDKYPREYWRVFAYNTHGGIIESRAVSESLIESTHNELMNLPGTREVRTVGPFSGSHV